MSVAFLAQEDIAVPPPIPGASVSRVVWELARNLAARNDVTVVSAPHPDLPEGRHEDGVRYLWASSARDTKIHHVYRDATTVPRRFGIPYRPLNGAPFYGRGYAQRGLGRLASLEPDVLHLQNVAHFLPPARRALPDARIVLHMHCAWLQELPRRPTARRLGHADLILGVSDHITDGIRAAFPELAERCATLYNGCDVERFLPRADLGDEAERKVSALRGRLCPDGGPLVLFVKTIAPETGAHVLLDAWESVLAAIPNATLVIAGAHGVYNQASWRANFGTELETSSTRRGRAEFRRVQRAYPARIRSAIERLGPRVVFAERVPHAELPVWYAAADVMVVPSVWHEPFGLPALEAAAAAVPVIVSDRGALPELIRDGREGVVVPPSDPQALTAAILRLCRDPELARSLGAAGHRRVHESFTWRAQAERLETLYRTLLG
jgi:glycosyltransferase involved in cell wall biosynthesis